MFYKAESFNKPLNDWQVNNILDASYLFYGAKNFNQELSKWKINTIKFRDNMCICDAN